jgi:hypothetical protein
MAALDHLPENASPVSVSQAGLIRLSAPARAIALDVVRVNSLQTGAAAWSSTSRDPTSRAMIRAA